MIFLALRHLWFRKRQSVFTLLGIFFGTAAFIIISGFFLGFREYLIDQLVSGDAHIKITKNDEKTEVDSIVDALTLSQSEHLAWSRKPNPRILPSEINNPHGWLKKIESHPGVIAAGFQLSGTALISKAGISRSLSIVGADIDAQTKITNIESKITSGSFKELKKGLDLLVIGERLAGNLGVAVDDIVSVSAGGKEIQPMKIVGIFSTGNRQGDRGIAYTSLSTIQKITGQTGKINQISVKLNDTTQAADIANDWQSFSQDKVESWDQANANFMSIFETQDMMRYATTGVLLLVAGFGIYNILTMVIMQKRRDIAILRSMGFDDEDVLILFLFQGILLGLAGSLLGLLVGYWVCTYLSTLSISSPLMGRSPISISFNAKIYMQALGFGVGVSCIAAYLPSRSAAKMTPIDIIRAGAE